MNFAVEGCRAMSDSTASPCAHAGLRIGLAQHLLRAGLMGIGVEHEAAGHTELALPSGEGPAGDDPRERRHVALGVAAVDAQRMQLHDLAGEVLVRGRGGG